MIKDWVRLWHLHTDVGTNSLWSKNGGPRCAMFMETVKLLLGVDKKAVELMISTPKFPKVGAN
jgi:hypothetical protein